MISRLGTIGLFALLAVSIFSIPLSTSFSLADSKVPVVILFKEKVSDTELDLIKSKGGQVTKTFTIIHGAAVNIPQTAINALKNNPNVLSVDQDIEFHAIELDADTRIGASAVWSHPTTPSTGNGVRVAILDTGIDTDNQEFGPGRILACNSEMGSAEPTCEDLHGHGTHVAGIVGASGVDSAAKGVAPNVNYLVDKVLNKRGSGSLSGIISGIQWAVNNNADVINMSLGTSAYSDQTASNCDGWYPSMTSAVNNAVSSGVTVVAAAGNSGTSGVGLPACISKTIAVAAVNDNDTIASFSSIGGAVKDHGISAPGVSILSSLPGNTYASWSGTSMATPVVAGSIALLLEDHPSLTPAQIKNTLFNTACKTSTSPSCPTGPVPNISYGYGRVNVLAAVNSLGSIAPTAPGTITNLSATAVSQSQINLSWSAPSNGGSSITGYKIERESPVGGGWSTLATIGSTPSYSNTGLVASTEYNYRVSAINSVGTGSASNEAAATTLNAPTAPGTITNLSATAVSQSQINLSWSAPSNGGSAITDYTIEYKQTSSGTWSTFVDGTSTTPSASVTGLASNTPYDFRVSAINSVGTGSPSNVSSATTFAAPTAPGTITDLSATAVSQSQINLSWSAPSNGGSSITGYKIERESPVGGGWSTLATIGSTPSYSNTGLVASTEYNYRVSAINSVGTGSASNEAAATTLASAGTTVGVDSITYSTSGGKNNDRHLTVSVHVKDNNNNNVSGASVSISLSNGGTTWTATGTTDSNGNTGFTLKNAPAGTYTTTIIGIAASGLIWDGVTPDISFEK